MHVFITGGTGFVGQAVIRRLVRDGHSVSAWVRNVSRARDILGNSALAVAMNDNPGSTQAVREADAVINLAGEPVLGQRWSADYRHRLIDSRVGVTCRLVDMMKSAGRPGQALVSASAIGIYGDRGDERLTETSPHGTGFLAELCEAWEDAAVAAEPLGVRVVRVRVGVVLGKGGGALGALLPLFKVGLGGSVGTGKQYFSWIHLQDLEEVFTRALVDPDLSGVINGTAETPVRYTEFASSLGAAVHRPAIVDAPAFALKLRFGEASQVLLASQRVIPQRLTNIAFPFAFTDIGGALRNIVGT